MTKQPHLRRVAPDRVEALRAPTVPSDVLIAASKIIEDVRSGGEGALRRFAEKYDQVPIGGPLTRSMDECQAALDSLDPKKVAVLERAAEQIQAFAETQLASARPVMAAVPAGRGGDRLVPVKVAGCYAPGGRFPLPSSVLMTAVTARAAGVETVWVASPNPSPETMAAAVVAGADGFLAVGGAQAVAAMALGVSPSPRCDIVVGPGNQWVTAAKLLLSGEVGIDLLAGPSELAVLSDGEGNPELIAADLLAQAEHDPNAVPVLITTSEDLPNAVEEALGEQLVTLPTADTAREALKNGFVVVASSAEQALRCCEDLAPEHLQLHGSEALAWSERLEMFGAMFVGSATAEVFGDYGVGPNHTLPTGGTARFASGLSVFSFLRRPTWLRLDPGEALDRVATDAAELARMEGLEGHARAAELRRGMRS